MHYDENGRSYGPHHDNTPAHASHLMLSFSTQVAQPPLHSKFGALRVLAFPKAKITFERD